MAIPWVPNTHSTASTPKTSSVEILKGEISTLLDQDATAASVASFKTSTPDILSTLSRLFTAGLQAIHAPVNNESVAVEMAAKEQGFRVARHREDTLLVQSRQKNSEKEAARRHCFRWLEFTLR
ncbi:hypothetical protein Agabi119p4_9082 [Agaricus bisporus var. burnettii]|uniref:Uncharacterized protein n=1 Tax=Agaricus bisporus var. burnettii TaxID=192524 RepID=A0A8H7EXS0_AGABI|nr:hypothetical protein Agabi119p4_9082 [Agaricus bisporus var. burnettii]